MAGFSWADVADDLLFLLAERIIGVPAFVRFSAVCKSWHSVASATKCRKHVPWLMMIEKDGSVLRDFYDHSTREVYQFPLPGAQRVKNLGFAHGWLITAEEDCTFHLVNILSGIRISLPPATFILKDPDDDFDDEYNYEDNYDPNYYSDPDVNESPLSLRNLTPVKATCSPIGPDGDGIVVLTHRGAGDFGLSFCQSTGEKWTSFIDTGPGEVAYINGEFYAVTNNGEVLTLDFTSSPKLIKLADLPQEITDFNLNVCFTMNSHIVACADDILIGVKIYARTSDHEESALVDIRLFKLDIKCKKVVDIKNIGDNALFFGPNNSFCVPTLSYGGCFKKNCIYFVDVDEFTNFDNGGRNKVGEEIIIYNLEDKSFAHHYVGMSKSSYSYPVWVYHLILLYIQNDDSMSCLCDVSSLDFSDFERDCVVAVFQSSFYSYE